MVLNQGSHLPTVIYEESLRAKKVQARIEHLQRTNESRLKHVELCGLHLQELKDALQNGNYDDLEKAGALAILDKRNQQIIEEN